MQKHYNTHPPTHTHTHLIHINIAIVNICTEMLKTQLSEKHVHHEVQYLCMLNPLLVGYKRPPQQ